ncbi:MULTISPECIES: hypothetical protein [Streptomyces]|uniref:Membrane protein n=1 Tax=Streptomyces viridochromogenes TaxID=1938 RepID=A0A0L8LET5_STRVR|nr:MULTISPECIES: hypothetical protein [Streptomyces]KOG36571.1 membrane protein [Streptomyces viridochromogenes]
MAAQTTAVPGRVTFPQVAIALQTLALFFQAVTAGMLLSSSHGYVLHDAGSKVMYGATMLYVIAAILAWRPGGGSPRPILYSSVFLVLASAQVVLGVAHMPTLHVPLGILMFGLSVLALGQALSTRFSERTGTRS